MSKLKLIRLIATVAKTSRNEEKGNTGEYLAREYFNSRSINFFPFPQSKGTKPESLKKIEGKRPDFAIETEEGLVYLDAKYHSTNNLTSFVLTEEEISQYHKLREWLLMEIGDDGNRLLIIMLFPQEYNGEKLILIPLNDFNDATNDTIGGKPAKRIDLKKYTVADWENTLYTPEK